MNTSFRRMVLAVTLLLGPDVACDASAVEEEAR